MVWLQQVAILAAKVGSLLYTFFQFLKNLLVYLPQMINAALHRIKIFLLVLVNLLTINKRGARETKRTGHLVFRAEDVGIDTPLLDVDTAVFHHGISRHMVFRCWQRGHHHLVVNMAKHYEILGLRLSAVLEFEGRKTKQFSWLVHIAQLLRRFAA